MNNLISEEHRKMEQAAEVLLSMANTQCDRIQSHGNAPSAQTSLDDVEMTDAAENLLLLSNTAVVFEHHPAPVDSSPVPAQSVQADVAVPQPPTAPVPAVTAPVARSRPAQTPINNPQWAGLTAAQQAQQQVRHRMTPWQRYQFNYAPFVNRDRHGNIIGRLYMTQTERRTQRQQQRR